MTDIPEDVMKAAVDANRHRLRYGTSAYEAIARAIMVERERCAKMMEIEAKKYAAINVPDPREYKEMARVLRLFARLIRKPTPS